MATTVDPRAAKPNVRKRPELEVDKLFTALDGALSPGSTREFIKRHNSASVRMWRPRAFTA